MKTKSIIEELILKIQVNSYHSGNACDIELRKDLKNITTTLLKELGEEKIGQNVILNEIVRGKHKEAWRDNGYNEGLAYAKKVIEEAFEIKEEPIEEIPQFKGTREALDKLTIIKKI